MIDSFLHNLLQRKFRIGKQTVDFPDCLLAVCAAFFGILIRIALNGTNEIVLTKRELAVHILLAWLLAAGSGIFAAWQTKSHKRGLICYTILLFLPTLLLSEITAGASRLSAAKDAGLLSMAYPNVFQLTGVDILVSGYAKAAVAFTAALIFIIVFYLLYRGWVKTGKREAYLYLLKIFLLLYMVAAFFLPYMQYGNGLIIDILFVILACLNPKKVYRALIQTAVSFGACTYGMTESSEVPFYIFSFLELFLMVDLGMEILRDGMHLQVKSVIADGKKRLFSIIFMLLISILAFFIRFAFRNVPSMDYLTCLKPWVDEFKTSASFTAISGNFYNYTPPYMYILYLISLLPCEPLIPIKLVSCLFDVILALFGYKIIKKLTDNTIKAALAYGVILCLPTVAVNSGMWGQCDVIYVTCILASMYLLYENKSHASLILYGLAFSLKLQALFVFPFYVLLWVHKKYKIMQFFYLPLVYFLCCVPAALAGKSIKELLLIYVNQGSTEPWMLSWNWPNIYLMFGPTHFYTTYKAAGILGTLAVIMLVLYVMLKRWDTLNNGLILKGMLVFALVVPFTLPYMHERYGYLADIFIVLYAFISPQKLYLAVLQILLSFSAYLGYLHGGSIVPQIYYCFAMIYLIMDLVYTILTPNLSELA